MTKLVEDKQKEQTDMDEKGMGSVSGTSHLWSR